MDLQSLVIASAFIILCIAPIIYIQRKQKKEKAKLLEGFLNLGKGHQLNITEHEIWDPYYAIGIDAKQSKLLYSKEQDGKLSVTCVKLSQISKCRVEKVSREINGNKVIDKIELVLSYEKEFKFPDAILTFYDKEVNLNLNNELLLAEKWKVIIDSDLTLRLINTAHQDLKSNVAMQV